MRSIPASTYIAPRDDPLRYPGARPDTSFVLAHGYIYSLQFQTPRIQEALVSTQMLDAFLAARGKALLGERYAVLGIGSNPVPGQLVSKFGADAVVPVIYGEIENADVVYNLISAMGYAFAELELTQPGVKGNVAITFLDPEQLRVMNRTEENYDLAFIPRDITLQSGEVLKGGDGNAGLFYAGKRRIWVPNGYDNPIAIAELPSQGRTATAMTQEGVLGLVIHEFSLKERGITTPSELAAHLRESDLKEHIQRNVARDPRSRDPVITHVTPVENPAAPPKRFGD
ncbi:MAG: hypothetical protein ACQESG_08485 [Nanobdellota archaeon]